MPLADLSGRLEGLPGTYLAICRLKSGERRALMRDGVLPGTEMHSAKPIYSYLCM